MTLYSALLMLGLGGCKLFGILFMSDLNSPTSSCFNLWHTYSMAVMYSKQSGFLGYLMPLQSSAYGPIEIPGPLLRVLDRLLTQSSVGFGWFLKLPSLLPVFEQPLFTF